MHQSALVNLQRSSLSNTGPPGIGSKLFLYILHMWSAYQTLHDDDIVPIFAAFA